MATKEISLEFPLHPRQLEFHNSPATEVLYGGAAGGGKSYALRINAITWALKIPNLQIALFRRSYPDLAANHLHGIGGFYDLLGPLTEAGYVRYRVQDNEFIFNNNARIALCHCDNEAALMKYQGREFHILLIDELTHFTETQYTFLRSRVRIGDLNIPDEFKDRLPRIECGSNPGSLGHSWVKKTFITPQPPMTIWEAEDSGMLRQYIPAKLSDNPTLLHNDPNYARRLEGLGSEALVRAMRDGNWDIVAGQAFDMFDRNKHVVKPFDIPDDWLRFRALDWGSAKPFSVGWYAVAKSDFGPIPSGAMVKYREWYGWTGQPDTGIRYTSQEVARGILGREQKDRIAYSVADPAIFMRVDGPSVAERMAECGVYWERGNNDRINGLQEVVRRLYGDDNRPQLFFFDTCNDGIIRTLGDLIMDERRIEDVAQGQEDHAYDELRYAVMSAYRPTPRKGLWV